MPIRKGFIDSYQGSPQPPAAPEVRIEPSSLGCDAAALPAATLWQLSFKLWFTGLVMGFLYVVRGTSSSRVAPKITEFYLPVGVAISRNLSLILYYAVSFTPLNAQRLNSLAGSLRLVSVNLPLPSLYVARASATFVSQSWSQYIYCLSVLPPSLIPILTTC